MILVPESVPYCWINWTNRVLVNYTISSRFNCFKMSKCVNSHFVLMPLVELQSVEMRV